MKKSPWLVLKTLNLPPAVERRLLAAQTQHLERRHPYLAALTLKTARLLASYRAIVAASADNDPHYATHLARGFAAYLRDFERTPLTRGKQKDRSDVDRLAGMVLSVHNDIVHRRLHRTPPSDRDWLRALWRQWDRQQQVPDGLDAVVAQKRPHLAALEVVAVLNGLDPESLRVRLHKAKKAWVLRPIL